MLNIKLKKLWLRLIGSYSSHDRLQDYARQQEKFKKRYPNYSIGFASYEIPTVHDNNEGTTLKIGAYCSIAENVHIFLGGQHRTNWVSSYPFPFFLRWMLVIEKSMPKMEAEEMSF